MSETTRQPAQIQQILIRWSNRWRVQRGITWGIRGFLSGWLIGILRVIPGLKTNSLLWENFLQIILATGLGFSLLFMIAAVTWPIETLHAARHFDRLFNLFDRLATAIELAEDYIPASLTFRRFQWQDTLEHANKIKIRELFPIQVPRRELVFTIIVLVSLLPIQKLAAERFSRAAIAQEVQEVIADESAELSELLSAVDDLETLAPETISALQEQLEETIDQLSQTKSIEPAVATLEDAIGAISKLQNPSLQNLDEVLRAVGEGLLTETDPQPNALTEALKTGEASTLADALIEHADNLSEKPPLPGFGNTLEALSHGLEAVDSDLANTISEANSALETGDLIGAQTMLEEAAAILNDLAEEQLSNRALEQVAEAVIESRDHLLENAGTLVGSSPGQSQNNGALVPGSSTSNNGGAGSGTGQGTSAQTESNGSDAGLDPIGTQNQPGDGGEAPFTSLFIPDNLGGPDSTGVLLPGQGEIGEQILGQSPGEIDGSSGSQIPYQEVFPAYEEAFREAIAAGRVPNHLVDLVRTYFSSLEP